MEGMCSEELFAILLWQKRRARLSLQRHEVDGGRARADDHMVHIARVRRHAHDAHLPARRRLRRRPRCQSCCESLSLRAPLQSRTNGPICEFQLRQCRMHRLSQHASCLCWASPAKANQSRVHSQSTRPSRPPDVSVRLSPNPIPIKCCQAHRPCHTSGACIAHCFRQVLQTRHQWLKSIAGPHQGRWCNNTWTESELGHKLSTPHFLSVYQMTIFEWERAGMPAEA